MEKKGFRRLKKRGRNYGVVIFGWGERVCKRGNKGINKSRYQ